MKALLRSSGSAVHARLPAYALAVAVTLATLGGHLAFAPWFGDRPVLLLFVIPILLSTYLGGAGPGLAATAVLALGAVYFLLPPTYSLPAERPVEATHWLILILSGVLISLLARLRHRGTPGGSNPALPGPQLAAERTVRRSFGLALVLLVVIGAISILSVSRLREQSAWEVHTHEVISTLRQVLALTIDVETASRGYILTGKENYLGRSDSARRALPGHQHSLRALTADNPGQQKHLDALEPLIAHRLARAEAMITLRREQGLAAVQAVPDYGFGKQMQDQIRELMAAMEATEQGLLREREASARHISVTTRTIVIGGGTLAFAFVALALYFMNQGFAGQHRVEVALREAEADLATGQQAQAALGLSHDEMERRVALRTAELSQANQELSKEIAGRRKSEVALLEAKERTESVLAGMTDIYFVIDHQWHYLYANEAAVSLIKQTAAVPGDEILSLTPWELFPAIVGTELERQLRRAMEERVTGEFDFHHPGQDVWWHYRVYPAAGGVAVFASDITASKRAIGALEDSEERFAGAFEHAPNGIALVSPDGRWLKVNQALCDLVGYTREEMLGRTFQDITHPEDLAADLEQVRRLLAGEIRSYQMEKRYIHTAGHVVTVLINVSLVRDDHGQPRYFITQIQDISERKLNEETLRQQKAELRVLFDLMPALIWFKDTDGHILRVNQRVADAAGKTVEEIEGKSSALIYPEEAAKYYADDLIVIESGAPRLGIIETLHDPAGKELWVQTDKVPVRDKDGKITGIVVMAQDITARRQAEENLLRNQALMRMAGRLSRLGAWSVELPDFKQTWSDEVCAIYELPPGSSLTVEEAIAYYAPEYRGIVTQTLEACVHGGTPFDIEVQLITATGRRVWVRSIGEAKRDAAGVIQRVQGAFQDISERKQGLAALHESETQFRQVVENIDEVFWIMDLAKNAMLYVSPAYAEIWGRSCESLCADQRTWLESVHPDDRERVGQARVAKYTRGDYDETFRIVRPDGGVRWIHSRAFPVRDQAGAVHRVVGVSEDITEYRSMEEQFRQTQKMEAIGTLAGGIAHDFNNILAAINGYTQLAQMTLQDNPAVREHLGAVLKASGRAADLVRQILTFSRQQPLKRRTIQLLPVVVETFNLLRATIPTTIEFDLALASDAPAVLADETQIHQILMNLGTNAWHAMKNRPGRLQVKLEKCVVDAAYAATQPRLQPGLYARVSVGDTGTGMDQATQRRIFEPFFTTKAPGEGTGLGLAVVHGIMDSHDGVITVYSQLGEGTVFHLYFPADAGEAVVAGAGEGQVPRGQGERILMVDDEELLARLGGKMLTALGYAVECTTQPTVALALVRSDPAHFALVITDQTMPGMTGLMLAGQLQQIRPGLPVILMTGYSAALSPEAVEAVGICQLLLKPTTIHALATAVRTALATAQPH